MLQILIIPISSTNPIDADVDLAGDLTIPSESRGNQFNGTFDRPALGYSPPNQTFDLPNEWSDVACLVAADPSGEPPLLDELEVYPHLILDKVRIMLNPLKQSSAACRKFEADFDLVGPMMVSLCFGSCMFVLGKQMTFQHVYVLCMVSVLFMHQLLVRMEYAKDNAVGVKLVASILGYGLVHMLWLVVLGAFVCLRTVSGLALTALAVYCAALGTGRILTATRNQPKKLNLIAVPLALIYCLFALFVVF